MGGGQAPIPQQAPQQAQGAPSQGAGEASVPPEVLSRIDAQAREAARRDVLRARGQEP
jgi:hypothetical protein